MFCKADQEAAIVDHRTPAVELAEDRSGEDPSNEQLKIAAGLTRGGYGW
jgi:hypothetical protein